MNPSRFTPCSKYRALLLAAVSALAGGCALHTPPREVSANIPPQWFPPYPPADAPGTLPHNGRVGFAASACMVRNDVPGCTARERHCSGAGMGRSACN